MIELAPLDFRIPVWDLDDLVERACPACGHAGDAAEFRRPDGLLVRRCAGCTTWYVGPAPSPAQIIAFYSTYDQHHRREPERTPEALLAEYRRNPPDADFRLRELASIHPLCGARVLDVGFGRARVLYDLARMGALPCGVELDDRVIAIARFLGIPEVTKGMIGDLPESERFDAILLCDLIEHPFEPLALLEAAATRLAAGGHLLVWTPNGDAVVGQDQPVTFRVDLEHLQYFTPKSLSLVAARIGLDLVHLETVGFPDLVDIDRPLSRPRIRTRVKAALRAVPGVSALARMRRALVRASDDRDGKYSLFALLERSRV